MIIAEKTHILGINVNNTQLPVGSILGFLKTLKFDKHKTR